MVLIKNLLCLLERAVKSYEVYCLNGIYNVDTGGQEFCFRSNIPETEKCWRSIWEIR